MTKTEGRFIWYELAASDVEKAKAFYTGVVGWSTADAPMSGGAVYTLFTAGGKPVAGLAPLQPDAQKSGVASQWMGYVGVADVDDAARQAEQLGGTIWLPPTDIPNVSRFSVISDPQRATLALIKGREDHDEGPAQPNLPGHVVWRELIASDWEKAFPFYNKLFGWQKTTVTPGPGGVYQEFSAGGETVGGMFNQSDMPGFSVWLYYFGVPDLESSAKRVLASGGAILYGPIIVPGVARIIQCRDSQGAVFGLMDRLVHFAVGCYAPREPHKP